MCVRERDRERNREGDIDRERNRNRDRKSVKKSVRGRKIRGERYKERKT